MSETERTNWTGTSGAILVGGQRGVFPGKTKFRQATGAAATLRWGYHTAAHLARWRVTRDAKGVWHLSAQVRSIDHFKASRRPLAFTAQLKGGNAWEWDVVEFRIVNHVLSARMREQEYPECEVASSAPRPSNSPSLIVIGSS